MSQEASASRSSSRTPSVPQLALSAPIGRREGCAGRLTFLLGSVGTHAYNATLYKKLPYNPANDFALRAVRRAAYRLDHAQGFSCQQSSRSSSPTRRQTEPSCNRLGRSRFHDPSRLRTANAATGVNTTHVSYRGGGPAMFDLIAGQVPLHVLDSASAAPADRERHAKRDRPIGTQPLVATAVPSISRTARP